MTPQEVSSHTFSKATLGGYNIPMVDEFLDLLTEDYTTLFNDNNILKKKLKKLSETIEEYQETDRAMRKTLLAAQKTADAMVREAEEKRKEMLKEADSAAQSRIDELRLQIAAEEQRLQLAKEATAAYLRQVRDAHASAVGYLEQLEEMTIDVKLPDPVPAPSEEDGIEDEDQTVSPEEDDMDMEDEDTPVRVPADDDPYTVDPDATRRFEDLQFGRNYEIT